MAQSTQVLFTQDMLDAVGLAQEAISRQLQDKKNLEQTAIFLQVYKDAMLSIHSMQVQLDSLQQQVDGKQVQLDALQQQYDIEMDKLNLDVQAEKEKYEQLAYAMQEEYKQQVDLHHTAIRVMKEQVDIAQVEMQQSVAQYNSALQSKRVELAAVQEQYDAITALLHGMARVAS